MGISIKKKQFLFIWMVLNNERIAIEMRNVTLDCRSRFSMNNDSWPLVALWNIKIEHRELPN